MINSKKNLTQIPVTNTISKIDITNSLILYGLMFMVALLPLISHLAIFYHISPVITGTDFDTGTTNDVFITYKYLILLFAGIFFVTIFSVRLLLKKAEIFDSYINLPTVIMACFILLSGVFSIYKTISVWGNFSNREGTVAYLLYLLLFFIAANTNFKQDKYDFFIYALCPFVVINFVLVLAFFFGYNILALQFIYKLVFPASIQFNSAGYHFNTTLGNVDYLSGFGGVCTVLFLVKGIFCEKAKLRWVNLCFSLLSFSMVVASLARSGIVAVLLLIPVIFAAANFNPRRKQLLKYLTIMVLCFGFIFAGLSAYNPQIFQRNLVKVQVIVQDESINQVVPDEVGAAEHFNLPPHAWGPGTGRIYIWEKTLELLKTRPFLGFGLDSLEYFFPQDDPAKASAISNPNVFVDKAHNMYLSLAFGTGIFTLLAFGWLIITHLRRVINFFVTSPPREQTGTLFSLCLAWCAYLIQGLFNDSFIGSAPVFWILFGISISIFREIKV